MFKKKGYSYELLRVGKVDAICRQYERDQLRNEQLQYLQNSQDVQEVLDYFGVTKKDSEELNLLYAFVEIADGDYVRVYFADGMLITSDAYRLFDYLNGKPYRLVVRPVPQEWRN